MMGRKMVIAATLAASVIPAGACPGGLRVGDVNPVDFFTVEEKAVCEEQQAHAKTAHKQIILTLCLAGFLANYEQGVTNR